MQQYLFARQGFRNTKIDLRQIIYIEARRNYTRVVCTQNTMTTLISLKNWRSFLPADSFCQIHRGFIVSIPYIESFDNKFVWLAKDKLPIGYQFRTALPEKVTLVGPETEPKK